MTPKGLTENPVFAWDTQNVPTESPTGNRPNYFTWASQIIDKAVEYNFPSTKDLHQQFLEISQLIKGLSDMHFDPAISQDELARAKANIYDELNDLVNELENLFATRPDTQTEANIKLFEVLAKQFKPRL